MFKRQSYCKVIANVSFNNIGVNNSIYREASAVDTFYIQKGIDENSGKEIIFHVDPLDVLFNQERLKRLGFDGAENYVKSLFHEGNSQLAALRKQCSDEDLLTTIKSRHLQSPSEILAWTRYMSEHIKEFNSEVQQILAKNKADEVAKPEQSPTDAAV